VGRVNATVRAAALGTVACLVVLAAALVRGAQEGAGPGGEDWFQFLGPNRNGVTEGAALASEWPKEGPPVAWKVPCRVGYAGVMVKDGVLVLMEREARKKPAPPAAGDPAAAPADAPKLPDEVIRGIDARTGEEIWRSSYPCERKISPYGTWGPCATPAGAKDKVVCLCINGMLRCLELKTGRLVWEKDLAEGCQLTRKGAHCEYQSCTSPLAVGDLVILELCSGEVGLAAFNLANGREVWRTPDFGNYGSSTGFMMMGETPVVIAMGIGGNRRAFKGGDVMGFNALNGQLLWYGKAGKNYYNTPPPIASEGLVVLEGGGGGGPTFAFRPPPSGEGEAPVLWKDPDHQVRFANYLIYRGLVFGQGYNNHNGPKKLYCIDPKDGTVLWEREPNPAGDAHQMMIGSDGKVIQLHENGELSMFDADARGGYKELARARVFPEAPRGRSKVWAFPALVRGKLYARSDTELVCVDLAAKP